MARHTTFRFALDPTPEQEQALLRHAGASRFAYNQCRRFVVDALQKRRKVQEAAICEWASEREADALAKTVLVPWSGFDLINRFNAWKRSPDAGGSENGTTGLSWQHEVCAQVFEEAAADCGRALAAWSASRRGGRKGRRLGFPTCRRRGGRRDSFRLRNNFARQRSPAQGTRTAERHKIRVGEGRPRSVALPVIGTVAVHDDTRSLRRMIAKGRARILFATVSRHGNRWYVSLNCKTADLHPGQRWIPGPADPWVGIDLGITPFAVAADETGRILAWINAPKPLRVNLRELRRESKAVSRRRPGSGRHAKAVGRISHRYARIRNLRRNFLHQTSTHLLKTHGRLAIEDLGTAGIAANRRLSRAMADLGLAEFARLLSYKAAWRGAELFIADRWYPSTKTCSVCAHVVAALPLSRRTWTCPACGAHLNRDANAAVNLAVSASRSSAKGTVAPKRGSTIKARGGERSGPAPRLGETIPDEASTEPPVDSS